MKVRMRSGAGAVNMRLDCAFCHEYTEATDTGEARPDVGAFLLAHHLCQPEIPRQAGAASHHTQPAHDARARSI